jgi:hypothetical protein
MSGQKEEKAKASPTHHAKGLFFLLLMTLALLVPFLDKPLHLDDPMYVWTAKRIATSPADFYGMDVNWCYTKDLMARVNENPPLVSYWLAAVGSVLGWSERVLHAAMLLPAILAIACVFLLALALEAPPFLAGFALLAMPGFLVSSTTLMADVLAMALWTGAVVAWVQGLQAERAGWLAAGALLAGFCILTKFVGLALLPLLLAYTLVRSRRLDKRVLWLGVPLGMALAYRARMLQRYGVDPFAAIGSYALEKREAAKASAAELPWLGLAYLGGAFLPALVLVGCFFRRRGLALCAAFMLAVGAGLVLARTFCGYELRTAEGPRFHLVLHLAAFITGGALVLALLVRHVLRVRSPEAILIALWVAGIFVFASFFNWSTNIRSLLPAAPAVAVVLASELRGKTRARGQWRPLALLGMSILAGLLVAQGDLAYARSARDAALAVVQEHGSGRQRLWYEGSWGFQYYMDLAGARKINWDHLEVSAGDQMVLPSSNCCLVELPPEVVRPVKEHAFPVHAVASTVTGGAGFYSHILGVVPYVFGFPPDEVYSVFELSLTVEYR